MGQTKAIPGGSVVIYDTDGYWRMAASDQKPRSSSKRGEKVTIGDPIPMRPTT